MAKYAKAEIQFWWNEKRQDIRVTRVKPPKGGKLATTFPASRESERWHRSMFTWLAKVLKAQGKPYPPIPPSPRGAHKQKATRKQRVSKKRRASA